jgi:hypothetical protein
MTAVAEQTGAWLAAPPCETAFQRFTELGFPTTHDEEWRFTNVAPIARLGGACFSLPTPGIACPTRRSNRTSANTPPSTKRLRRAEHGLLPDVTYIHIPRGQIVEQPIQIAYDGLPPGHSSPHAHRGRPRRPLHHRRNLLRRRLVLHQRRHRNRRRQRLGGRSLQGPARIFLRLPRRRHVRQPGPQRQFLRHLHLARRRAGPQRSQCHSSEGTDATLNGLYLVNGAQHVDNHTSIDHAKPHGTSHELYKGILDGKASAVFNGRIIVRKDAQKTDSKQTNKNLVLSDEAVIDTKPELQIFADDVRCTHGATIGQLDAESLFYLQSRGIGKHDARSLLTYAFAQDIVDRIKFNRLKDSLERFLFEKFHEHAQKCDRGRFRRGEGPGGFPGPEAENPWKAPGVSG